MNKRKLQDMESYKKYDNTSSGDDMASFICNVCDFSFETQKNLNHHKKIHNNSKITEFICEICHFECRELTELKVHVDSHFDNKCFACNECDFTCKLPFELRIHAEKYHGAKTYECDMCGFKSRTASGLRLHKQTHQELICELCDFSCSRLADLKTHIDGHAQNMAFRTPKITKPPVVERRKESLENSLKIQNPEVVFDTTVCKTRKIQNSVKIVNNVVIQVSSPIANTPAKTETHKTPLSNGSPQNQTNSWSNNKNFQDIFANFIK